MIKIALGGACGQITAAGNQPAIKCFPFSAAIVLKLALHFRRSNCAGIALAAGGAVGYVVAD